MPVQAAGQPAYFSVTPADEDLHEIGPEPQWNESAFFHVVEEDGRSGLLFRIGRRVNEGFAEVTALQLRAGGDALVGFQRAPISGHDRWRAGSLDFTRTDPAAGWAVCYDGELSHLADGADFAEPGRALRESAKVAAVIRLTCTDLVPPYRTTTDGTYHGGAAVAQDHYAGVARVTGTLALDGQPREVRGFGFRDHSWGVRDWQAIDCWRWFYGQADAGNLFSVVQMKAAGAEPDVAGLVVRAGRPWIVKHMTASCRYTAAAPHWMETAQISIPHPDGAVVASFEPSCRLPLRHRRGNEVLRIVEQLATVAIDGAAGAGWFETADRLDDGMPFGMTHGM
jgi:hypothetical protein